MTNLEKILQDKESARIIAEELTGLCFDFLHMKVDHDLACERCVLFGDNSEDGKCTDKKLIEILLSEYKPGLYDIVPEPTDVDAYLRKEF